jgi:hypothetical protein
MGGTADAVGGNGQRSSAIKSQTHFRRRIQVDTPDLCASEAKTISPSCLQSDSLVVIISYPLTIPSDLLDHRIRYQLWYKTLLFDNGFNLL